MYIIFILILIAIGGTILIFGSGTKKNLIVGNLFLILAFTLTFLFAYLEKHYGINLETELRILWNSLPYTQ